MSVLENLAAQQGLTPIDFLFRAGMMLSERGTGAQLTAADQQEIGQMLVDAARHMRRDQASIKALTDELLEEQVVAAREAADVIAHPALMGVAR